MKSLKNITGWIIIVILSIIPLIIWSMLMPFNLRFSSPYGAFTSFGTTASLIAMPLFSISFFLSGRYRFLEDFFGGMNKVYVAHHITGGIAFILLMLHPLFLAVTRAMISWKTAAEFFLPSPDWGLNFGIISLAVLMLLMVFTYFIKLKYYIWHFTHKFMGVAFGFGILHVLLIDSDVSVSPSLKWYLLILAMIGLIVYSQRTLFGSSLVKRFTFTVIAVEQVHPEVWNIRLRDTSEKFNYLPGQFVFVKFYGQDISDEIHPFTISSSPEDADLTLTVKKIGDFTAELGKIRPGNTAKIEGPFGRFFDTEAKNQIWIAGGIGVTPFLSKARSLKNLNYAVDFYYLVKKQSDAVYLDEILAIAALEPNFRVCLYDTSVEKRITGEIIAQMSGSLEKKDIYICGPPPMMASLRQQFNKLGVQNSRIHTEEFQLL